ncbi:uncharacterized protein LOC134221681 [Armigeres subalbatus]|uniref:uncharacterized protein LOC134221681 n=1 Tax=Armigeres subalbatus TaxID=124917 RepID=UPI002ED2F138
MQIASQENTNCKKCTRPDDAENMVGCDTCDAWQHYGCAGVSESIAGSNRSWKCDGCRLKSIPVAEAVGSPSSTASAYTSASSKKSRQAQLRLELLEQQNEIRMRKLEEEEKYLKERFELLMRIEEEEDAASSRSRVSARSKRDRLEEWLEAEVPAASKCLERECGDLEVIHDQSGNSRRSIQATAEELWMTAPTLETQSVSREVNNLNPFLSQTVSAPAAMKNPPNVVHPAHTIMHDSLRVPPDEPPAAHLQQNHYFLSEKFTRPGPVNEKGPTMPMNTRQTIADDVLVSPRHEQLGMPLTFPRKRAILESTQAKPQIHYPNPERCETEPVVLGPTATQLAARQVMARDLPFFSGDPEDWPIFYSSFKNSTAVCGYSDAENLARLQRCLRGSALDSVRSRLLLPSSVASVMATLRMLFGRPEILINSLLRRVRSSPAPKADNLKSIVDYGLAVQNLIDHMIVSEQQNHLANPLLLNELVEKLLTHFKLQWSSFKQTQLHIDLRTFNAFISNLVCLASDLLVNSEAFLGNAKASRSDKHKEKLFVHSEGSLNETEKEHLAMQQIQDRPAKGCSYCEEESHQIAGCHSFETLTIDARWKSIRSKNLCRTCLVPHRKWPCRSKKECGINGCRSRHHQLLHTQNTHQLEQVLPHTGDGVQAHQNHHRSQSVSIFRYIPVKLFSNNRVVRIFAFLDEGSSSTLLEAQIAEELGLDGPSDSLWLSWTGNISREEKGSKRISVTIAGDNLKQKYTIDNIQTVDELNLPRQSFDYENLAGQFPHLVGLPLKGYTNITPRIIIGLEHVRLLTALKTREGRNGGPVVVKTRLGWCAFGKDSGKLRSSSVHLNHHALDTMSNQSLHEVMRSYFAIEESAVSVRPEGEDDKRAIQILERTTVKKDNYYETGLLWRMDDPTFPNSLPMAIGRLKSLERRLARDPKLAANVQHQIADYIEKGYAHEASEAELQNSDSRRVWYLPLGVVVSPKKPDKIRLIWDAAAKVQGINFNDLLLRGPDLLVSLVEVILRFRERSIAVCGDICEMFHQIKIRSEDKQYQRFLWRNEPGHKIEVYIMDVATFGATCSPCSVHYVKNKNAEAHAAEYPRAAMAVIKNHYVDDFLDSTDTVEEAIELVNQVKTIHSAAGFKIRKFRSIAPEVVSAAGETEQLSGKPINGEKQVAGDRVLGLIWDPAEDAFTFDASGIDKQQLRNGCVIPTKRQVLQVVMRIFDPLGFVSHYTIHGKILMQEIWRSGTNWNEPISQYSNILDFWYRWSELLAQIGEVKVPRCYFGEAPSNSLQELQVHIFVDASESAYACVAYLRMNCVGGIHCAFLASKTKVAPLKPLSIPRLELQAAMIGARLLQTVCTSLSLPVSKRYLWTDSTTVLAWLRSDSRRYHQFVGFRVGEILSLSSIDEWKYVPSRLNVADEATKWTTGPTPIDPYSQGL